MFKNHIKIAIRFFKKNLLFTGINIAGLSLGITAFILLMQFILFERSYDQGLENVYRVTLSSDISSDKFTTSATNHPAVGPALMRDIPEIEAEARMVNLKIFTNRGVLSYRNAREEQVRYSVNDFNIYYGESSIFDLFKIPFLQGNPLTALDEPMSTVISEKTAKKFFGDENPLGKEIVINSEQSAKVTGVFEDLPQNTHLRFDILVSFATLGDNINTIWAWPEFYNYVKLKPGINPETVETKFPGLVNKYLRDIMSEYGFEAQLVLQPVGDIHLTSHLIQEMSANTSAFMLYFLMLVAVLVIGIATMNFINMSTAKSMERAKEVGIKKVVGAEKNMLIFQFLTESVLINFIAVLISVILVILLMKPFNQLLGMEVISQSMWFSPQVWIILLGILLMSGLMAGLYPAFVLSGFKPIEVLKGKFHQSGKGSMMRKGLVISQFAISLALICGTYIIYRQFDYMRSQELGFNSDQNVIINAPIDWNSDVYSSALDRLEVFKDQLKQNPQILNVTFSSDIPGKSTTMKDGIRNRSENKDNAKSLNFMAVDHDFLDTYDIRLTAGRGFVIEDKSDYYPENPTEEEKLHRVIINESTSKALGYENPEEALHRQIVFKYGPEERTAEVIGVVEDYHQQSLQTGIENMMLLYEERYLANHLTVHIQGEDIKNTVASIKSEYQEFFPKDPFNYFFLDDYFNLQYQSDAKFGLICLLFSVLAIFIAAIGLFGMGSHMAIQKTKEISVRKVLGATMTQALWIIPRKLLSLVLFSAAIALPLVYFFARNWLDNYAFKIPITVWMFLMPLLLVLVVAMLSILTQSFKIARVNPAVSLSEE
jgi:putative ABC transport system permease protein